MKTMFALMALAGIAAGAQAQVTYNDAVNDLNDNSFAHLDITSVTVSNDANSIFFTVTTRGSVSSPNWGKFMVGIKTAAPGGTNGNGWARPIDFGTQLINFWVGTWADNGGGGFGGELRQMTGPGANDNVLLDATYTTSTLINGTSTTTQNITVSRTALGLTGNQTFLFDVMSSGGGGSDGGYDHLSLATPTAGFAPSTAGQLLSYTIPTPGGMDLLGLGGLVAARRRRA